MPLTDEQKKVIELVDGSLVVVAGPGSGKTHTIIEKIFTLFETETIPEPYGLLAITFTNAAANEMRSRLRKKGFVLWNRVWIGTYHSFGQYLLSCYGGDIGIKENFRLLEADEQTKILNQIKGRLNLNIKTNNLISTLEKLKRKGIYPNINDFHLDPTLRSIYGMYQHHLKIRNCLDFGDLVALSVRLLDKSNLVRRIYTNFFKYVIVDEFQDSDPQQLSLISVFANSALGCTIVADDDQSIYKFRGAVRENIKIIKNKLHAKEIYLGQNFRSDQIIVEAAKAVIEEEAGRVHRNIKAVSNSRGVLFKAEFPDEESEASKVAEWISQLNNEENWGNVAIITRTRFRANHVLSELDRLKIPWFDRSRLSFQESWEISLTLAVLLLSSDPNSAEYLHHLMTTIEDDGLAYRIEEDALDIALGIRNKLLRFNLKPTISDISDILEIVEFNQIANSVCWSDTEVKRIFKNINLLIEDLETLESEINTDFQDHSLHLKGLIARILGYDAVQVMSGHASKGREFNKVFLVGLEDDVIPSYRSHNNKDDIAEERRIFYVSLTRAKKSLYLTYASERMMPWKKKEIKKPSRFLKNIPDEFFSAAPM